MTSAYEYLERRFNAAARLVASGLFILFQCGRIAIVLYLPSLALATVSNLDVSLCILLMGVLCIVYTVVGGIEAVIWTDVAQAVVLLGGAVWALVAVVWRVDGGVRRHRLDGGRPRPVLRDGALEPGLHDRRGLGHRRRQRLHQSVPVHGQPGRGAAVRDDAGPEERSDAPSGPTPSSRRSRRRSSSRSGRRCSCSTGSIPGRLDPTIQTDAIFPLFVVRELPAGVAGAGRGGHLRGGAVDARQQPEQRGDGLRHRLPPAAATRASGRAATCASHAG